MVPASRRILRLIWHIAQRNRLHFFIPAVCAVCIKCYRINWLFISNGNRHRACVFGNFNVFFRFHITKSLRNNLFLCLFNKFRAVVKQIIPICRQSRPHLIFIRICDFFKRSVFCQYRAAHYAPLRISHRIMRVCIIRNRLPSRRSAFDWRSIGNVWRLHLSGKERHFYCESFMIL